MIGAISGDIIGSVYEHSGNKKKDFPLFRWGATFTDDTVLTIAVAEALLSGGNFAHFIRSHALRRPFRGYGKRFFRWMLNPWAGPYLSLGNGSAMRVSPVAYAFEQEAQMFEVAAKSADCTHNHREGIQGAQAVAFAVFLARKGTPKDQIRSLIQSKFGYELDFSLDSIRQNYRFNSTCRGSVPQAIIAFLDSNDFEDAIRNAISLGGDADTQAAIAGAIAEAHYGGVPPQIANWVWGKLPNSYRRILLKFHRSFGTPTDIEKLAST